MLINSNSNKPMNVGGQAVIEGVMMRGPKSIAIACRKPNNEIVLKEDKWISISEKLKFLKWPVFRGVIVLFESLINGIQALSFSANVAAEAEQEKEGKGEEKKLSKVAIAGSIIFAFILGMVIFVIVPHLLTEISGFDTKSFSFHLVDGIIKIIFFLGYIIGISFLKDIRRVFQYHGAEHKSIFAFEAGEELTVENIKKYTTKHARCGTSFIMIVLIISIFFFSAVYPFMPEFASLHPVLKKIVYIFIKIPLMFPIAGLAYETIKLSAKYKNKLLVKIFIAPGIWIQYITTKEPTDDMIEVAVASLKAVLEREGKQSSGETICSKN